MYVSSTLYSPPPSPQTLPVSHIVTYQATWTMQTALESSGLCIIVCYKYHDNNTCPSHHLSHICGHDPITSRQLICIKYTKIPYPLICPFNISDLKFFIHPLSILSLIYPAPAPAPSTLTARPRPRLKISCI